MTTPDAVTTTLPLSSISIAYNPRRYFDRTAHAELVASLKLRGMLQPMLVRPAEDGTYTVVAGGRRYRAALEAFGAGGSVPVIIRQMSDQEALEAAIDENDVRDDASETEQADAAVRVLAACRDDRAEAARRLGWSQTKLDRRLALANLSETVKQALDERRIKVGHAELLAAVPADKQDKALETILAAKLDVAKTRELLMRVTQALGTAIFDKSECTLCPFNSAAQRALFETHVDDGHCTNPACFQLKTEAVEQARAAAAAEEAAVNAESGDADPIDDDADIDATNADTDDADDDIDDETDAAAQGADEARAITAQPVAPAAPSSPKAANPSPAPAPAPSTPATPSATHKPTVTAKSIAQRTSDLREATWRTALARSLADRSDHARTTILAAAMSGTLSQIKPETLTSRAALLIDAAFPKLDYRARILEIIALPEARSANLLCAIAAAYARDVTDFRKAADLATIFAVDIRTVWRVDQAFLDRYTKDELRFIARECGLVTHLGEKAFAKLLGGRKPDLVAGMLNATGFDWAGRLPSGMTLDGRYGAPPAVATVPDIAA